MSSQIEKTPLTEQQARSLAHWWGGQYQEIIQGGTACCHGVVVTGPQGCRPRTDAVTPIRVFSLEEAIAMENRRGFQDACSPDWVG